MSKGIHVEGRVLAGRAHRGYMRAAKGCWDDPARQASGALLPAEVQDGGAREECTLS